MASPSESAQEVPASDAGYGPDPAIHHHTYQPVPADDADKSHNVAQNPFATSPSPPPAAQVTMSAPYYPPSASADTAEAAAVAAARREKGRVRFNSNATTSKPPVINFEPPPRVPERTATPSPKLRPSILRANSSGSVATAKELGIDLDATSEKAISAAVAQARAQQVAAKVLRDSPPGSRASMDSLATTAASDGGLLPSDSHIPLRNLAADGTAVDSLPQTPEHEPTRLR
ncbi:hypothetical protein J3459_018139 [Metarhizium acridum]|nr:hypothetical protein J3459_018139 [Metarhizium acridum]